MVWMPGDPLTPGWQGLLCPKTLPRHSSRTLGWVAPTGLCTVSLSPPSQPARMPNPAKWALPVLCQHRASVSFHPAPLSACVARWLDDITVTPVVKPCGDLAGSGSA